MSNFSGENCTDRNHCASNPCLNDAACFTHPTEGFTCQCQPGYTGTHCDEDVNECLGVLPMCYNGGICENLPGSFQCRCTMEWTGTQCDYRFVPCQPSPCENGATCVRTDTYGHVCECRPGEFCFCFGRIIVGQERIMSLALEHV